jgi:cysteine-rich repeat protein
VEECQGGQCVAKTTTTGSPIKIRCRACEACDPALACQLVPAVDQHVCRAAFGSCDAAEICDGADPQCPDDVFKPAGSMCDDGNVGTIADQCVAQPQGPPRCVGSPDPCGNGTMDPGEQCDDGNQDAGDCCSPTCQHEAAGTPCPDATVCNGAETCDGAGHCQAGPALVCDPGTICATAGQCDPIEGCQFPPAPAAGCHTGFASASLAVSEVRAGFERLKLDLKRGPALNPAEFGNPVLPAGTAYTVCVYRKDNGALAGDLQLDRAGGTCGTRPCWRPLPFGKGFQYSDRTYATDGIGTVKLASSGAQSQIQISGRNNAKKGQASLPAGLNPPGIAKGLDRSFAGARVQIRRDDGGACFEADLGTVIRSGPTYFRAEN